eukprot:scaffold166013_cov31-Attheya_sp.AAC.1
MSDERCAKSREASIAAESRASLSRGYLLLGLPDGVLETVGAALIDGVALVGELAVVRDVLVDGVVLGAKLGATLGIPKGITDGSALYNRRNYVNPCCPTVITTINECHPGPRNRYNLWKKGTSSRDGTASILEGQDR